MFYASFFCWTKFLIVVKIVVNSPFFIFLRKSYCNRPFSKDTIILFVVPPKFCLSIVFNFSWGNWKSQEKLKTMLMQNFEVTSKSIIYYSIFEKGLLDVSAFYRGH